MLTAERAGRFARLALGHVIRDDPHKADHVMDGHRDIYRPRHVHAIFYRSFDLLCALRNASARHRRGFLAKTC